MMSTLSNSRRNKRALLANRAETVCVMVAWLKAWSTYDKRARTFNLELLQVSLA